jgi:hypothetical protein
VWPHAKAIILWQLFERPWKVLEEPLQEDDCCIENPTVRVN